MRTAHTDILVSNRVEGRDYCYYPTEVYENEYVASYDAVLPESKDSVDTGTFIPGVYRINPYSVSKEEIVQNDNLNISAELDDRVSCSLQRPYNTYTGLFGYKYNHTLTGALGPMLFRDVAQHKDLTVPSSLENLGLQALQKAYGKVREGSLPLGESIGEIRETFSMLQSPLRDLRDFLWKNRKRNLKELNALLGYLKTGRYRGKLGARAAKAATNTWLEIRYGFRPLIYLIGDCIDEVRRKHRTLFNPFTIRTKRSRITDQQDSFWSPEFQGDGVEPFRFFFKKKTSRELVAHASVQYKMLYPLSALENFGLTPRFWPGIAWELTRLSFVVDWFFSVGPWISSYRSKPGIKILGNTLGTGYKTTVALQTTKFLYYVGSTKVFPCTGTWSWRMSSYSRNVNVDLPLLPQFTAGRVIELFRSIDLAALTWQQIASKVKRR